MLISHVSATQIATFTRCQAAWYFSYVEKIKGKPTGAMTRGTCVHRGISANFTQKVESHVDMPVIDVLDFYDTTFTDLAQETDWKESEDPGKVKDAGYRVLEHYQVEAAPQVDPVDVEQSFRFMLTWVDGEEEKSVEFKGILDLLDRDFNLRDLKTTGQTPKVPGGDHVIQLIGYSLGKEAIDGKQPSAWLDYLVTTKTPKIVTFPVVVEESQKKFFLNNIPRVVKAMEAENYYPARGNRWCSETACYYWEMCRKEFGESG